MTRKQGWHRYQNHPVKSPEIFHFRGLVWDETLRRYVSRPIATMVLIEFDETNYTVGVSVVKDDDNFSYRTARNIAGGRAHKAHVLAKFFPENERPCYVTLRSKMLIDSLLVEFLSERPRSKRKIASLKMALARLGSLGEPKQEPKMARPPISPQKNGVRLLPRPEEYRGLPSIS